MTTIDAEEEMNSATASSFGNLTQDHTVVLAGTRGGGASSSHRLSVSRVALLSAHPCAIPCHAQVAVPPTCLLLFATCRYVPNQKSLGSELLEVGT